MATILLNGASFDQFINNYAGGLLKNREASIAPEILRGTSIHYIAIATDVSGGVPALESRVVYFAAPRTAEEKLTNAEWAKLGNAIRQSQTKPPICFDIDDTRGHRYVIVVGSLSDEDIDYLKKMENRVIKFLENPDTLDADDRLTALVDANDPVSDI